MWSRLDGTEFESRSLSIESWQRQTIDRAIAGLDSMLSIDLGLRGRHIVQKGLLRAVSAAELIEKIDALAAFMDGKMHSLLMQDGRQFDNLRIDSFQVQQQDCSGTAISCEFEIEYTQLRN